MTGRKEKKELLVQHKEIKIFTERGQIKHGFLWNSQLPEQVAPALARKCPPQRRS